MRGAREVLDDMLVLSCQSGDARALELLARRWHPRLLRHAYRLTGNREAAADAAQDAWIGIVRGIRGLRDPARFGSWALQIVRNKSRDWIRGEARRRGAEREMESRESAGEGLRGGVSHDKLGETAHADADVANLRRAMAHLSDVQRVILRLFYVEDRSVGEISEILTLPPGTVKSRLFYARRRLRESVETSATETQSEEMSG